MSELRLYILQRGTALVMVPLIALHLGVIVYAIADGLTASEILGRTRGSVFWALVYGSLVVAAAVHGAIGLRTVFIEWLKLGKAAAGWSALLIAGLLLVMGLRAVYAVVVP